jgi:hypothetical protein
VHVVTSAHLDPAAEAAVDGRRSLALCLADFAHLGRPCSHTVHHLHGTGKPAEAAGMRGYRWLTVGQRTFGWPEAKMPMGRGRRGGPGRGRCNPWRVVVN